MEDNNAVLVFEKMTVPELAKTYVEEAAEKKDYSCTLDRYFNAMGCGIRPLFAKNRAAYNACIAAQTANKTTETQALASAATAPSYQPSPAASSSDSSDSGLGLGAWIGIGIGVLAAVGTVIYFVKKGKQ